MERPVNGDVVVVNFPFTDLTSFSKRPALVIANIRGEDTILCQITTQQSRLDEYAVILESKDFNEGKLSHSSYIRVNKLFTASKKIILKKIGKINEIKISETKNKLCEILQK